MVQFVIEPSGDNFDPPFRTIKRIAETIAQFDDILVQSSSPAVPVYGSFYDVGVDDITLAGAGNADNLTLARDANALVNIPQYSFYFSQDGSDTGNWTGSVVNGWTDPNVALTKNSTDNEFGNFCVELASGGILRRSFTLGTNSSKLTIRYKTDGTHTPSIRITNTITTNTLADDQETWVASNSISIPASNGVYSTIEIGPFEGENNVDSAYRVDLNAGSGVTFYQGHEIDSMPVWVLEGTGNPNTYSSPVTGFNQPSPLWKGTDYQDLTISPHAQDALTLEKGGTFSTATRVYYRLTDTESLPSDADLKFGDGIAPIVDFRLAAANCGFSQIELSGGQKGIVIGGTVTGFTGDDFALRHVGGMSIQGRDSSDSVFDSFVVSQALNTKSGGEGGLNPMPIGAKGEGIISQNTATLTATNFTIDKIFDDCIQPIDTSTMVVEDFTATSNLASSGSVLEIFTTTTGSFTARRGKLFALDGDGSATIRDKAAVEGFSEFTDIEITTNTTGNAMVVDNVSRTTGELVTNNICVQGSGVNFDQVTSPIEFSICAGSSTIDCRYEVLVTAFGSQAAVPEMMLSYVQNLIFDRHAVTPLNQITDAWNQLFTLEGITGARNDKEFGWLVSEGATGGSLTDLWNDYWCIVESGSAFSSGFSQGFN